MWILEVAILACLLALLVVLLVAALCYTRIRLAEIRAGVSKHEDGEPAKVLPGSVEEGFENIMTYRTGDGDSL